MDERVINELIMQLSENLKKVESARLQVEKTVQAYDVLKTEESKYTTELGFITQNVRAMISQLEEMKERFLGNISTKIVDEILHAVTAITASIDGVSSKITALNAKTDQVNDTINGRANTIDSSLSFISSELKAIDVKVSSCSNLLEQLTTLINSVKSDEKAHFDRLANQLEEQESRLNSEFNIVRKQNRLFSIVIIILLFVIAVLFYFKDGI